MADHRTIPGSCNSNVYLQYIPTNTPMSISPNLYTRYQFFPKFFIAKLNSFSSEHAIFQKTLERLKKEQKNMVIFNVNFN